jgi:hypothetical protein
VLRTRCLLHTLRQGISKLGHGKMIGSGQDSALELSGKSDRELRLMLAEWRRWRAHVQTAPVMRLRRQRFEEATAAVAAIEEELRLREPGERLRQRRLALSAMQEIAHADRVCLDDYRSAQRDLASAQRRR